MSRFFDQINFSSDVPLTGFEDRLIPLGGDGSVLSDMHQGEILPRMRFSVFGTTAMTFNIEVASNSTTYHIAESITVPANTIATTYDLLPPKGDNGNYEIGFPFVRLRLINKVVTNQTELSFYATFSNY